jgi:2-iminoacetate synthase
VSAGSHTEPGGYEHPEEATGQFEVADLRSPGSVAGRLRELGYDPVWENPALVSAGAERRLRRDGG